MNDTQRAIISWIRTEDGGRKTIPPGPTYAGVVHFEEDEPNQQWSFILDYDRQFANPRIVVVSVRFLAPDAAPMHLLRGGSRFELFEGKRRVAKGIMLSATVEIPAEVNEFESALIG